MSRAPCKPLTQPVVDMLRARLLEGEFGAGAAVVQQSIEAAGRSIKQLLSSR